jgi:hypothetical protein
MAKIPSIIRTFGAYFQEKRKAKFEAKKRTQEKKALEKRQRKTKESLSPNSLALNAKITSNGHDIVMPKPMTSTSIVSNKKKKNKKKEKIFKDKSPMRTCRSVHMIFTPMGNKR